MSSNTKTLNQQQLRTASLDQQVLHTSIQKSDVQDIYQQVTSDSLTVERVFSAISDNKSLSLFNIIAVMSSHASDGQPTGEILISRLNMTRKQYYTRINQLRHAGLITKRSTRFVLTSLGRIVYETHKTIGVAIQNRWKLDAIDSIQTSQLANRMPTEERQRLINTLLGDCDKIKDILL
jgi:biotin operon repressor